MQSAASYSQRCNSRVLSSLHGQEPCLFEEHIRAIWKKLQPGFVGKVNYIDEKSFHEFAVEANRNIDQVCLAVRVSL